MSVHLVAPLGGFTEQPDDIGLTEPFVLLDDLVAEDVVEVTPDTSTGGRPPTFPWGGHSNGVSSDK